MRVTRPFILAFFGLVGSANASEYIYNLGTLPAPYNSLSVGLGISPSGNHVVGQSNTSYSYHECTVGMFRYDGPPGAGVMRDLGIGYRLDNFFEDYNPRAVNSAGQVAGSVVSPNYDATAFRYTGTPGGEVQIVQLGGFGGTFTYASAINESGQVAGSSAMSSGFSHAFRYDFLSPTGGTMHDLGALDGRASGASGMNDAGNVVGSSSSAAGSVHAFVYTGTPGIDGVMHDLGGFDDELNYTAATDINSHGDIVGYAWDGRLGAYTIHAFRYDGSPGAGRMRLLDELDGQRSNVFAINDDGFAVGLIHRGFEDYAVLWRPDGSAINLDEWLDQVDPVAGARWNLRQAKGISNNGLITGLGAWPGTYRAFVLDVSTLIPEPTWLGFAFLPFALHRQRRIR